MKLESIALIATAAAQCSNYDDNVECRSMSTTEQDAYLNALQCLKSKPSKLSGTGSNNLWEDLVYIHAVDSKTIHNTPRFLPWHRGYLAIHDELLKTACGYKGKFPYWDWAADSQKADIASIWDRLGALTAKNADCVQVSPSLLGPLSSVMTERHKVQRCYGSDNVFYDYSAVNSYISRSKNFQTFDNYIRLPHTQIHVGIGGDMNNLDLSPNDPIFFFHHRMVDYFWDQWQRTNKNYLKDYNGRTTDKLQYFGLAKDATVADVLDNQSGKYGGLMCKKYEKSVVPIIKHCKTKQTSLLDTFTPATSDVTHKYNIRVPKPLSADNLRSMGISEERIASLLKVQDETKAFIEFINQHPIRHPSSLGKLKAGLANGWRQPTEDEFEQTKKIYESLVNEFDNGNHAGGL